jgi:hypothetical protein
MLEESKRWCKFNPKYKYDDAAKFSDIIEFFLWNCPVENTAYGAENFSSYGWIKPYHFKSLKKKCGLGVTAGIPYQTPKREDFFAELKNQGQFNKFKFDEAVIILSSASKMTDFFKSIRNAFAHASFMVRKHPKTKEYFYFLENRNPESKKNQC